MYKGEKIKVQTDGVVISSKAQVQQKHFPQKGGKGGLQFSFPKLRFLQKSAEKSGQMAGYSWDSKAEVETGVGWSLISQCGQFQATNYLITIW